MTILLASASCRPEAKRGPEKSPFFDLELFFEEEAERLASTGAVDKKIVFNGVTEEQRLESWDAGKELSGFKELHINRPAWRDQYLIDSLRAAGGELEGVRYMAIDSSLRIREVEVDWKEGAVEEVRVEKYVKNVIVFFHQTLRYRPGEGYSLWREQKVPLMKRSELEVNVSFRE